MKQEEILPLTIRKGKLYIISDKLKESKESLEEFLIDEKYMNTKEFSSKVLFSQEIKNNNDIEGYKDDVGLVYDIVNKRAKISDKEKMQRIKNLYNGYKYIFNEKEINKENLKDLYKIMSKGLLKQEDLANMGKYYRNGIVYIFYSDNPLILPDEGVDYKKLDNYMDELFDYIKLDNVIDTPTDHFIKSQVLHFQFVNIHPYFDINGRTSRTLAMWYLLNNKAYPYIIFNRAINLNRANYYRVIREVKKFNNVTFFIKYMLDNVRVELEKEHIIDMIKNTSKDLTAVDYQTLYYILSMNSNLTVKDFATFYNLHNDTKRILEIYKSMLEPLLDKEIILKVRNTDSKLKHIDNNFIFEINKSLYEVDPKKIKSLKI